MKKFWKYFILTILLLLGLACVGILYLFFVPNSSLFGICYISYNSYVDSTKHNVLNVDTITLNSHNYDVSIVSTEEDTISVKIHVNSLGFTLTKNKNSSISSKLEEKNLIFNVVEPTGALFKNSSYVELSIPNSKAVNLKLKNNNATTTINDENIQINNFSYTTNNGDCNLTNAKLGSNSTLNLNLNKATCNISEQVSTSTNNVVLNMTSGKFNAPKSVFKNITIESNTRGIVEAKQCSNITQETNSAGGRISIETASFVSISSSSTNVYINTITDNAFIELSETGNISIETTQGPCDLSTNSGNINITNAKAYTELATSSGNISVSKAFNKIDVSTIYGTINIAFDSSAENKFLSANLEDGKIISSGLEKVNIVITGNGRVDLNMADVVGTNSIIGNTGSVFVKVNKLSDYKLTTKSEGRVCVNLAQIPIYGGYTTKEETTTYVNCYPSTYNGDSLNISTKSGNLTVLDSNFA